MCVGTILCEEVPRKQVCLFVIINFVRYWCALGILVMMPVTCGHPLDWKFSIVLRMWRRNEPERMIPLGILQWMATWLHLSVEPSISGEMVSR